MEVQKSSYDLFLSSGDQKLPLDGEGIQGVFQSVFPIKDFNETSIMEFVGYELEKPKYDVEECQQRGLTYASPLKVTLRLEVWEEDEDTGATGYDDIWKTVDFAFGKEIHSLPDGVGTDHLKRFVDGLSRVAAHLAHRDPADMLPFRDTADEDVRGEEEGGNPQ